MIQSGFLSEEDRKALMALARDASSPWDAMHRLSMRVASTRIFHDTLFENHHANPLRDQRGVAALDVLATSWNPYNPIWSPTPPIMATDNMRVGYLAAIGETVCAENLIRVGRVRESARHHMLWFGVTAHPTAEWIARQLAEACGWEPVRGTSSAIATVSMARYSNGDVRI